MNYCWEAIAMNIEKFLDELIGTKYKGKDGKMHNYSKLEEADKIVHRDDQYKKMATHLHLLFPRFPLKRMSTERPLDELPLNEKAEVIENQEKMLLEKEAQLKAYKKKLAIIFWFQIQENNFDDSLFSDIYYIKKRGGLFAIKGFDEQKVRIDNIYLRIPETVREDWDQYFDESSLRSIPSNYSLSESTLKHLHDNNKQCQKLFESFDQAIWHFEGQISVLYEELIECQYKKTYTLKSLSKQECEFIKYFMKITTAISKKDFEKLKKSEWEIISLDQRRELLRYIDKLYANPYILNRYVRAEDSIVLRTAVEDLHLKLNNPILHRVRTNLDNILRTISGYTYTPITDQDEIFGALENATNKFILTAGKIDKKDMNFLSLVCERKENTDE